jgi:HAE1 family hydrophobic/amphiphilic exporter-1
MTSFAFIAGLIPLVRATGPGAVGNRTIGAAALGGMLVGTVIGVVLIPGLYYVFGTLAEGRALRPSGAPPTAAPARARPPR